MKMKGTTPAKTPLLSAEIEHSDHDHAPPTPNPPPPKKNKSTKAMSAIALTMNIDDNPNDNYKVENSQDDDNVVREKKQGHKFFFLCCDTKRAVIFLNTAILLLNLFTFTAAAVQVDPETEGFYRAMVVRACGMFVTFSTLLGAYWYSKSVVLVGLIFTCYQLTAAIIKTVRYDWGLGSEYNEDSKIQIVFPVLYQVLLFYAETMFISEVSDGIMSDETYKRREKYSCCCNC